jgi:hypothetical protein
VVLDLQKVPLQAFLSVLADLFATLRFSLFPAEIDGQHPVCVALIRHPHYPRSITTKQINSPTLNKISIDLELLQNPSWKDVPAIFVPIEFLLRSDGTPGHKKGTVFFLVKMSDDVIEEERLLFDEPHHPVNQICMVRLSQSRPSFRLKQPAIRALIDIPRA